jgi:hypothetical protein
MSVASGKGTNRGKAGGRLSHKSPLMSSSGWSLKRRRRFSYFCLAACRSACCLCVWQRDPCGKAAVSVPSVRAEGIIGTAYAATLSYHLAATSVTLCLIETVLALMAANLIGI